MELLLVLRRLMRRWWVFALGLILAVSAGVAIGAPPRASSGLAWTRVVLDTPTSQLIKPAPSGADTLPWRASLLIHLTTADDVQRELAARLGVPPDEVVVVDPALSAPIVAASNPMRAAEAAQVTGAPFALTLYLTNSSLPMITLEAVAPTRADAAKLVQSGVGVLQTRSPREGAYTSRIRTAGDAGDPIQRFEPFLVQQVAPIKAKTLVEGSLPTKALVAASVVFALWVAGALAALALSRRIRTRRLRAPGHAPPRPTRSVEAV